MNKNIQGDFQFWISVPLSIIESFFTYYTFCTISLFQWCVVVGIFNCWVSVVLTNCECRISRNFITMLEILLLCYYYLESAYMSFLTLLYMFILLQCHWRYWKKSRSKKTGKIPLSLSLESWYFTSS